MTDERREPRLHVISYVKVCESDSDRSIGRVVDMTTRGMRLRSRDAVQVNTTLRFRAVLPGEDYSNREITFEANVIWCEQVPDHNTWDTGVLLSDVSVEDSEVIERFVEQVPYEDRWLALARCFPNDN
jgi:PilZ domain-containing protein